MIRRDFVRQGIATLGTVLVAGVFRGWDSFSDIKPSLHQSVSFDIVTDQAKDIVRNLGGFLQGAEVARGNIRVRTKQLAGSHVSDVVFMRDNELIDFRKEDGRTEKYLRGLSGRFDLLSSVESPTLVNVTVGAQHEGEEAVAIQILSGNVIVARRLLDGAYFEEKVLSERGSLTVRYDAQGVRVVDASCKHKTCVNAGSISQAGESVVCIPSRLRVVVEGERRGGVDVVSQ